MDYELITDIDGNEFVVIDNGNGNFTTMTKAYWDELQAQKEIGETL